MAQLQQQFVIELELVDIADSEPLVELGASIPVLECRKTGERLHWPFAAERLTDWLMAADAE